MLPYGGLVAAALLTAGWAIEEIGVPGYHPTRQSISALGSLTTPHAWIWNMMVSLAGLGIVAFGVAMQRRFRGDRASRIGVGLLYVWGVGFFIDGFVRLDNATPVDLGTAFRVGSWHQRAHLIESVIDITAMTAAPFVWRVVFRGVPGSERVALSSLVAGVTVAAADLWFIAAGDGKSAGIAERVLIVAACAWLAGISLRLLAVPDRLARR